MFLTGECVTVRPGSGHNRDNQPLRESRHQTERGNHMEYVVAVISLQRQNSKEEAIAKALHERGRGFRTEVLTSEEAVKKYPSPMQDLRSI